MKKYAHLYHCMVKLFTGTLDEYCLHAYYDVITDCHPQTKPTDLSYESTYRLLSSVLTIAI